MASHIHDQLTTAFLDFVEHAAVDLGTLPGESASRRYRVFAGKSARLLRRGDLIALSDLRVEGSSASSGPSGIAQVIDSHLVQGGGTVFVLTQHHSIHIIPASRLVLVHRAG